MGKRSAKRREKHDDDGGDLDLGSDMISRLPDSVLHRILCFLSPKKAVQTSVLSKSWRHLGPTRPVIDFRGACTCLHVTDFCEECFNGNNKTLLSVVDNAFQRYLDQNLSVQELRLDMLGADSQSISILEKWIPILINPDKPALTTFRLSTRLQLPSAVFKSKSLENLCLHNCIINSLENIVVLKNLQNLSLNNVYIEDETLQKVMSGCPSLEYVELSNCKGLKTVVSIANENLYLKEFKFFACYIQNIYVPTLQRWKLSRDNYFPHLKSLHLYSVQLSTDLFGYFSCNFPLLEEFTLYLCSGFDEIKLFSHSLKHLTIDLIYSIKVDIDAPNILYFTFSSRFLPTTISFTTFSREWKSQITLDKSFVYDGAMVRFLKLNDMLKAVSQSQISLDISERMFYQSQQIECGTAGIHDLVAVEHLNITSNHLHLDLNPIPRLFYALFQICRPRYIIALNGLRSPGYENRSNDTQIGEVAECIWETLMHQRENKKYYWEQHLEDVSIEAYDFVEKVWHRVPGTCLPESEYASNHQKIRFGLKWRHLN